MSSFLTIYVVLISRLWRFTLTSTSPPIICSRSLCSRRCRARWHNNGGRGNLASSTPCKQVFLPKIKASFSKGSGEVLRRNQRAFQCKDSVHQCSSSLSRQDFQELVAFSHCSLSQRDTSLVVVGLGSNSPLQFPPYLPCPATLAVQDSGLIPLVVASWEHSRIINCAHLLHLRSGTS